MGDGQHRMTPQTWQSQGGVRLVWTRFEYDRDHAGGVEVRIVVGLPGDEPAALATARHLAGHLLQALDRAGATPTHRRQLSH
jgi:hypothetical protein